MVSTPPTTGTAVLRRSDYSPGAYRSATTGLNMMYPSAVPIPSVTRDDVLFPPGTTADQRPGHVRSDDEELLGKPDVVFIGLSGRQPGQDRPKVLALSWRSIRSSLSRPFRSSKSWSIRTAEASRRAPARSFAWNRLWSRRSGVIERIHCRSSASSRLRWTSVRSSSRGSKPSCSRLRPVNSLPTWSAWLDVVLFPGHGSDATASPRLGLASGWESAYRGRGFTTFTSFTSFT
ncbi:hypothetical protein FBY31_2897 [Arthrobacter sp. SLBN-100]|nr:hypothetical protein FBY31_2897 [Arthrobacter sp. SLBN-100]